MMLASSKFLLQLRKSASILELSVLTETLLSFHAQSFRFCRSRHGHSSLYARSGNQGTLGIVSLAPVLVSVIVFAKELLFRLDSLQN